MSKVITVEILFSSVENGVFVCVCVCFSHIPHNHSSEIKCIDKIGKIECPYDLRKLNKKDVHSIALHAYCGAHIYTSVNLKYKSKISSENVFHNLISSLTTNRRYAGARNALCASVNVFLIIL